MASLCLLLMLILWKEIRANDTQLADSQEKEVSLQELIKNIPFVTKAVSSRLELPETSSTFQKHLRARRNRPRPVCDRCYCYSRVYREHFCCECLSKTCFPEDAQVLLESGRSIPMEQLRLGHKILTATESGRLQFSPVIAFLDRRPEVLAPYLTLTTTSGEAISLSGSHVIFQADINSSFHFHSRFAQLMIPGDLLWKADGNVTSATEVQTITTTLKQDIFLKKADTSQKLVEFTGAYVPLTETGTLFVDGILASCYASVPHQVAHAVLAPVRWFPSFFENEKSQLEDGVRGYIRLLKYVAQWIFPTTHRVSDPSNGRDFTEILEKWPLIFITV